MTSRATGQPGVIHRGWRPGDVATIVAGVALTGSWDVCRRLCQGIDCHIGTAVAGGTVPNSNRTGCSGMAHCCRAEGRVVVMTSRALSGGRNMGSRLAKSGTSVARRALADGTGIVRKGCIRPGCRRFVAGITLRRSCNVCS